MYNGNARTRKEREMRRCKVTMAENFPGCDKHQITDTESSENIKQEKYQKNYTHMYHI